MLFKPYFQGHAMKNSTPPFYYYEEEATIMITLLKWCFERWKIVLVAITILALLAMVEYYRSECQDLRTRYIRLEADLSQTQQKLAIAENSVFNLKTSLQLKTTEAEEVNKILKINYESMQRLSQELAEIDEIMYNLSGEDTQPLQEDTSNASINARQNEAGVDLINRQLQSID